MHFGKLETHDETTLALQVIAKQCKAARGAWTSRQPNRQL